jgi:histidinol-phosphate aminotransferase
MSDIASFIRPNILTLKPYTSARDEFQSNDGVFFDANENPNGKLNRYPDPYQKVLKAKLSVLKNVPENAIFIGNGSDEIIDLLLRVFCEPNQDKIIICPPTYGMYQVSADINAVSIIKIPLNQDFQLNVNEILNTKAKLIFICSPNNPTGNNLDNIEIIAENFNGIVVIDEAYIDFSSKPSFVHKINQYPNIVVMQTLSKAWGLAAVRVGMAFANQEIITYLNRVKPPYNVSTLNQKAALETLNNLEIFESQKNEILLAKDKLETALQSLACVKRIYPSQTNFFLVEVADANAMYKYLVNQKLVIRNRNTQIPNCVRITVGTQKENEILMQVLINFDAKI